MFHDIRDAILKRMNYLENMDRQHRSENAPAHIRLRQVPRETGMFLALLASLAPKSTYLEIGTSGGYSALWLSLACRHTGTKLITFEVSKEKFGVARETFRLAGVEDIVKLIHGDARAYLGDYTDIGFCFLDAEKEIYAECYDMVVPNMMKGGILVADNVISHKDILASMVDHAMHDARMDAVVVPIGSGELVCVKR
ncbi:methyltransferase [candidate division WOR_3 bacterium SM23_60]|uniref:Methyltransferase n=1 Tax=candidate division WOR_3 bacterium SM23_60 TaxID=1703780 RepID=A0A0S8GLA0_UNCW3|nr:MAG: methyltransferase [candidate division WOR_3 bacterium SM23_60]